MSETFKEEIEQLEKKIFERCSIPKKYLEGSHVVSGKMIEMWGQCVCRECMLRQILDADEERL